MIQYNGRSIILSWHSLPPSLDLTLPTFLYLLDNPAYYTPHYQVIEGQAKEKKRKRGSRVDGKCEKAHG